MARRHSRVPAPRSTFAGCRFPPHVITVAVRWYLCSAMSYRDVEGVCCEGGRQARFSGVLLRSEGVGEFGEGSWESMQRVDTHAEFVSNLRASQA